MKKALLALALVGTVSYGAYRIATDDPTRADSEPLVLDRVWIDHVPRSERDTVQVFIAISEEPMGAFQASSMWKGTYELFRYQASGRELKIVYPQTGDRETVQAVGRRCTEGGMDYCLELDGGTRGVKRYYSREGWEIDGVKTAAELRARTDAVIDALD